MKLSVTRCPVTRPFQVGLFRSRPRFQRREHDAQILIESHTASTVRLRWYVYSCSPPSASGQARAHNLGLVDNRGAAATQAVVCQASSHAIPRQQITQSSALSLASPPSQTRPTTTPTSTSRHRTIRSFSQRPTRERRSPGRR